MLKVNANNFEKEVLQSNLPVVVDFWAPWCVPCKKLTPLIEAVSGNYNGKVKFVKLNVEEASSIASSYMIMSIPAIIIFKDGTPCEKKTGLLSKAVLEKFISSYI